jgi:hypothetical protein
MGTSMERIGIGAIIYVKPCGKPLVLFTRTVLLYVILGFTMILKNRYGKANNKSSPIEVYEIWALVGMMYSLRGSHRW